VASLNDEAAKDMERRVVRVHEAVQLLDSSAEAEDWLACLAKIADQLSVHGLLLGRTARLLFDQGKFSGEDVARRLSLMISRGTDPAQAAWWIEGFLSSSGLILLHHEELFALVDQWVCSISTELFNDQVPLLRRTFSTFAPAERRQIGQRVREGLQSSKQPTGTEELDHARAARVLPILRTIFGAVPTGTTS
jgi:hypothetical protein